MGQFFNLFWERLVSETPKFFKKIIALGITLGTIGGSLLLLKGKIPDSLYDVSGYLMTIGIVAAAIAKSTTTDKKLKDKSEALLK